MLKVIRWRQLQLTLDQSFGHQLLWARERGCREYPPSREVISSLGGLKWKGLLTGIALVVASAAVR
jgi:hypothetical protein